MGRAPRSAWPSWQTFRPTDACASCSRTFMPNGLSTWVYRDGRRRRAGHAVMSELIDLVHRIRGLRHSRERRSAATDALVACGALEAALRDADHVSAASLELTTDGLAAAALGGPIDASEEAARLERVAVPSEILTSTQEGCAFYALAPSSYARAARQLGPCEKILVIGVRTIGATLSAMVGAEMRARGVETTRCTVRPEGHPYDRVLQFDSNVQRLVTRARADRALVAIADEGPGLSGSTFLAVAEALSRAGVPDERIVIIASSPFDPSKLAAPNAANRYRRFRVVVAPIHQGMPVDSISLSGGAWRAHAFEHESAWPAVFAQSEREKWLVDRGTRLVKFEGLGVTGRAALARVHALHAEGFASLATEEGDGYVSTAWTGTPSIPSDVDVGILERIAIYCALRPVLCPSSEDPEDLSTMVAKNLAVLGHDGIAAAQLAIVRPAIVDGRMAPYEWLRQKRGAILKCDAIDHGDDHFFPGPTDIAWDLAGAIIEWRLSNDARDYLLERYMRASSDDARARIDAWIQAYATFREAMTTLALHRCCCPADRRRLARDVAFYRAIIEAPPIARHQS